MKFNQLLQRFFGSKKQPAASQNKMPADSSEMIQKALMMIANTQEVEFTCDEVFAVLDQFAELAARGEDVSKLMPLVKHHLDMCPDCQHEYEALESIVLNVA